MRIAEQGYALLFTLVFFEAVGFPVPAALALLAAGAAAARGILHPGVTLAIALAALLAGDLLMFLLGRYTGWWLLGLLCRISLNPESCVLRSADSFYRRGRTLLVVAKFIPGINTLAPPVAGSMNMRIGQFLLFDGAGACLYAGLYLGLGFLLRDAIGAVVDAGRAFSGVLTTTLAVAAAGYLGWQIHARYRLRALRGVRRVDPAEVAEALERAAPVAIYDVRSHGYYEPEALRIRGSQRVEPNALTRSDPALFHGREAFLYCTCYREATSIRVAHELQQRGIRCAVIEGGLRSWREAGLPVEPVPPEDRIELPAFA